MSDNVDAVTAKVETKDIIETKIGENIDNNEDEDTKLVRNLGATNLLEEGKKLQVSTEQKVQDEKNVCEEVKESETDTKKSEYEYKKEEVNPETSKETTKEEVKTIDAEEDKVEETTEKQGEIFSSTGLKGVRLPRHRDQVTVFPSGCMGVPTDEENAYTPSNGQCGGGASSRGRRFLRANELQERDSGHLEGVPRRRPPSASHRQAQQHRNPLTGEGYLETDFICGHGKHQSIGKHDPNATRHDLGKEEKKEDIKIAQTKDNNKNKRIPPGGFSTPLW